MKRHSLLMILSILIIVIAMGCSKQEFDGDDTSNDTQFAMEYSVLNCTKTHEIKLEKGAIINAIIISKSGDVDVLVEEINGEEIYKGDNASSSEFSLNVDKTGTYMFTVTGNNAKGSVSFKIAD
ncbi:hypothetical protein [Clostridium sp.]|uniref:hypothetical protein n=1 Tax=Clostridium sp. TaxID=1506 RepID=UPI003D6D81B0